MPEVVDIHLGHILPEQLFVLIEKFKEVVRRGSRKVEIFGEFVVERLRLVDEVSHGLGLGQVVVVALVEFRVEACAWRLEIGNSSRH